MDTILDNLNSEQLAAVTLPSQSALILAGCRFRQDTSFDNPNRMAVENGTGVDFRHHGCDVTNKAAKEMLCTPFSLFPVNARGMWIGTFHGLCNRLLRTHYQDAALPQSFNILDSQDQLSTVKRLLKTNNIDDDKYPPRNLVYFINHAKESGYRASHVEPQDDYERKMVVLYSL